MQGGVVLLTKANRGKEYEVLMKDTSLTLWRSKMGTSPKAQKTDANGQESTPYLISRKKGDYNN